MLLVIMQLMINATVTSNTALKAGGIFPTPISYYAQFSLCEPPSLNDSAKPAASPGWGTRTLPIYIYIYIMYVLYI